MKKICMTFLSCVSIIGSAQCLYTPGHEMPMAKELHAEETNEKIIDIDTTDTSHISPEFVMLASMKIDGQMNEEDMLTSDHLLKERAIELAEKGDNDFFHAAIVQKKKEDVQPISNEKPAVKAGSTEPEERTNFEAGKVEPSERQTEAATETELAESESVMLETAESEEEKAEEPSAAETEETAERSPEESVITVTATAYTADCEGGSGITYTGVDLKANPDAKVIAVDPSVIPLGTEVYVEGYGHAVAADIGGAIKGNKIDVFIPNQAEAESWGVQTVDVTIKP